MKKLFAFVLGLIFIALTSVTAFAATNNGGDTDIAVSGKYKSGAPSADVVSVDLVWDDMSFTYTAPSKGDWNPATHQYDGSAAGSWSWNGKSAEKDSPVISLTNHSNVAVKASFAFNSEVTGLSGRFGESELTLATAEGTAFADAPKAETSFSLDGNGIYADKKIGNITVTVAKSDAPSVTPTTPDTLNIPDEPEDSGAVLVSTAEEYQRAVESDGKIKLANDIEYYENIFSFAPEVVINLNGHTLNSYFSSFSKLTLKNGTVNVKDKSIVNSSGELTVKNCTIRGGAAGQTIDGDAFSKITFSGKVTLEHSSLMGKGTIICLAGTYNFDPTSYIDTAEFSVTKNADGTWTVK